ncbi:threonine-phosphate decarboxylase [Vibrio rarus]|uniref:threonine-phosphate decarboxylase n=1 Tax=Vibrio rarus TaxID=413403 RepID=UPI0021C359A2|nr:threonine-phosphate decarboxylase [Vibrio rarus]
MIKHGGGLIKIAKEYATHPSQWMDLSTGVSPFTYPLQEVPVCAWNQLPQTDDGLEEAAKHYYQGKNEPIAVAGSQGAIMSLPATLSKKMGRCGTISLPRVGYKEHQHAWSQFSQGSLTKDADNATRCDTETRHWELLYYYDFPSAQQIESSDVVLIINPNNPTAKSVNKQRLSAVCTAMSDKGGYLIVDEAFADCTPETSLLNPHEHPHSLIVLRSVGKFFGLAGARVGFVFASAEIKGRLEEQLGPWTVSGPARWVVKKALLDTHWHAQALALIQSSSARLNRLLQQHFSCPIAFTHLFCTVYLHDAVTVHEQLCHQHVLTRLCDEKNALRFGLPASECQWRKLESALCAISHSR